jgi:hypothetical protein
MPYQPGSYHNKELKASAGNNHTVAGLAVVRMDYSSGSHPGSVDNRLRSLRRMRGLSSQCSALELHHVSYVVDSDSYKERQY